MADLGSFGGDGFAPARILPPDDGEAPEPDVSLINGRPAEPWEIGSRSAAILADRERCNDVLSGLVRRQP